MKVLLLGYGSIGQRHAAHADALGHEVRIYDPTVTPTMDDPRPFGVISSAWEWQPDAVVIASPAETHLAQLTHAAIDLKLPTFVEKPLVSLADEGELRRRVIDAGYQMSPIVQVGYNMRFVRAFQRMRGTLQRGALGTIRQATFRLQCNRALWPGRQYAETLLECSHEIDLALYLLGPADLKSAVSDAERHRWTLVLEQASGSLTTIQIDDGCEVYRRGGEIVGDTDVLTWDWQADQPDGRFAWQVLRHGMHFVWDCPVLRSYQLELSAFFDAVKWQTPPPDPACSLGEAMAVMRACQAAMSK